MVEQLKFLTIGMVSPSGPLLNSRAPPVLVMVVVIYEHVVVFQRHASRVESRLKGCVSRLD